MTLRTVNNEMLPHEHYEVEESKEDMVSVAEMLMESNIQKAVEYFACFLEKKYGEETVRQMDEQSVANNVYDMVIDTIRSFK